MKNLINEFKDDSNIIKIHSQGCQGSGPGAPAGKQEVFMPLVHRAGEGQADFDWALAKV